VFEIKSLHLPRVGFIFGLIAVMGIVAWIVRTVARRIAVRRGWPEPIGRPLGRAAALLAAALVAAWGVPELDLGPRASSLAETAVLLLIVLGASLLLLAFVDALAYGIAQRGAHRDGRVTNLLLPFARKFGRTTVVIGTALTLLGLLGVNVPGLIAGLGIGGLVIALAAKDSVENVFGSFTILLDMPFALGDQIKYDRYEGFVEEINLRSTRIRTLEDAVVTIPNSNLIRAAVENLGARRVRRLRHTVTVGLTANPEAIQRFGEALRTELATLPEVDPARILVEPSDMSETNVLVLVQVYVTATTEAEEARLRGEMLMLIKRLRVEWNLV